MKTSLLSLAILAVACGLHAAEFAATGPVKETKLEPAQFLGAVKVTFDLLPTTMSFDLPWHFCTVSENGLKFAHFAAETYDPPSGTAPARMLRSRRGWTRRGAMRGCGLPLWLRADGDRQGSRHLAEQDHRLERAR